VKRDRNGRFVPNRLLPPVPAVPIAAPRSTLQLFDTDTNDYQPAPQPDEPPLCCVCGRPNPQRMVSWSGLRTDFICADSPNCLYSLVPPPTARPTTDANVSRWVTVEPTRAGDPRPRVNQDGIVTDYPIYLEYNK